VVWEGWTGGRRARPREYLFGMALPDSRGLEGGAGSSLFRGAEVVSVMEKAGFAEKRKHAAPKSHFVAAISARRRASAGGRRVDGRVVNLPV
jgi:hypothetical protein